MLSEQGFRKNGPERISMNREEPLEIEDKPAGTGKPHPQSSVDSQR